MKNFVCFMAGVLITLIICVPYTGTTVNNKNAVIEKKDSMINVLLEHLEEQHDCDLPMLDGDWE